VWWLGVFIAPPTKMAVWEAVCRWAHRTVTVHYPVRLLAPALTLCALSAHCSRTVHLLQTTVGAVAVAPHGTPDSPVNYSGVAFPET
jgi:hypothetical protein